MPTSKQTRYITKLEEIIERYSRMEDRAVRQMTGALQDLRQRIAADLLEAQGFEAFHLRTLQDGINMQVDEFMALLEADTRTSLGNAYRVGNASVVELLEAAGIVVAGHIDVAQLNAVMDFSADLIQAIGEPMRAQINTQLRLAVLGEQSPFKAMRAITDVLGIKARDGRWGMLKRPEVVKGVAARAEAILRTEMTRVYNMAQYSQQRRTAKEMPGVRKQWMATGDDRTRDSHLRAHGQTVPVNKPFSVNGAKLMFPGDPSAPASETISCRCMTVTIHVDIGPTATPLDKAVEKERQRRDGG